MIRGGALADVVTLVDVHEGEPSGESVFGDPEYDASPGVVVRAMVQPLDATEDEINRDVRLSRYLVTVDDQAQVDGLSEVEWKGDRYSVIGEPRRLVGHLGSTHHQEFEIRNVKG